MNITLPDGRKATVINQVNDKMVTLRLEDGRETMWPIEKLPKQEKEGEDTLKLVKVSRVETLRQYKRDWEILKSLREWVFDGPKDVELNIAVRLYNEATEEFNSKWGLI